MRTGRRIAAAAVGLGLLAAAALGVWVRSGHALQPGPCSIRSFEGEQFAVCRYDPARDEIRLASAGRSGPLASLANPKAWLGDDARRVAFAVNAGMYDPDLRPVGLYVEAGRTLKPLNRNKGSGNFHLLPNGVFWIDADGGPHVDETSVFAAARPAARWATQSGPLLVQAGALHPKIAPNGASLVVRNAVGVHDGKALFVISKGEVSFGRLARFMRDALGCRDALYLDGSVSSLWAPELGRMDSYYGLGTFVVVLKRN